MEEEKFIRLEWHATDRELNLGVQHVDRQERYFRTWRNKNHKRLFNAYDIKSGTKPT